MKKTLILCLIASFLFAAVPTAYAAVGVPGEPGAVEARAVEGLQLDHTSISVKVGEVSYLNALDGAGAVTWSSADPSIATVSGGIVTGKRLGSTLVTATDSQGRSTSCYVHVALKGIDVSAWQGLISWPAVKNTGVDFAIIRTGYGKTAPEVQTDAYFATNYAGAVQNGIKVGVYHYSYAENVADAIQEARFCLSILNGRALDYPVFYDIEEQVHRNMSREQLADVVEAFCSTIAAAGYTPALYSSPSIYNSSLASPRLDRYDRWVASWGRDTPNFNKPYTMWQYAYGSLPGVSGNVDLNYSFKDYSVSNSTPDPAPPVTPSYTLASDTTHPYTFGSNKSYYYKVTTNSASIPTAESSNPAAVSVSYEKSAPGGHIFRIDNRGPGSATITTSIAEGPSVSFVANGTSQQAPSYDLSSDTTQPYTFGSNKSYYYKITTNSTSVPTASSSNPAAVSVSYEKPVAGGHIFRIDNRGAGSATITTSIAEGPSVYFVAHGSAPQVPSYTLSSDTTHPYTFGTNKSYYYKITTNSASVPTASSSNPAAVSVSYEKPAAGGHIFRIDNRGAGSATITTSIAEGLSISFTANGSAAQVPAYTLSSDTTHPYTFGTNKSYYYKITTNSASVPTASSSNPAAVSVSYEKPAAGGHIFRIDNRGVGSATITTSIAEGPSVSFTANGSAAAPPAGGLRCDTTAPFTMKKGSLYTFLFTPEAGVGTPAFTTGNGSVITTAGVKIRDGSYLVTVKALQSGSTGMYATLPGQAAVKYCTITVE